jgi:hypothetical protein
VGYSRIKRRLALITRMALASGIGRLSPNLPLKGESRSKGYPHLEGNRLLAPPPLRLTARGILRAP